MNHLFKRSLSLIIAVVMVLAMIPANPVHVHAAGFTSAVKTASLDFDSSSKPVADGLAQVTTISHNSGLFPISKGNKMAVKLTDDIRDNFLGEDGKATIIVEYLAANNFKGFAVTQSFDLYFGGQDDFVKVESSYTKDSSVTDVAAYVYEVSAATLNQAYGKTQNVALYIDNTSASDYVAIRSIKIINEHCDHKWMSDNCATEVKTCDVCQAAELEISDHLYQWKNLDKDNHQQVCTACNTTGNTEAHKIEWTPNDDGTTHTASCDVCNTSQTSKHQFKWQNDADEHRQYCNICKYNTEKATHNWNEGVETTAPTCTEPGVKTYTCNDCERTKTEAIAPLGHNYEGAELVNSGTNHYKMCVRQSCDYKDEADHSYTYDADGKGTCVCGAETTCSEHNVVWETDRDRRLHRQICKKCGYVTEAEACNGGYVPVEGGHQLQCKECEEYYGESHGHTNVEWLQKVAEGHEWKCLDCGHTKTETHDGDPCTKCGYATQVKVATLEELINALKDNTNDLPIVITAQIVIPEDKTVTLDLNGKTVNSVFDGDSTTKHIYALKNYGTLTITDSKSNGSINSRGIYNYGSLTLEAGAIKAIDGNGGYAVNNETGSTFVMNGGWIAADNEDGDAPESGNYDATALDVPDGCTATLNGGKITNAGNFTFAISVGGELIIPADSTVSVEGTHGVISMTGSGTATIYGGSYKLIGSAGTTDSLVYVPSGSVTINGGSFDASETLSSSGRIIGSYDTGRATINGGTFTSNGWFDFADSAVETVTVNGGEFANCDDTVKNYVAESKSVTLNGETYTNAPAVTYVAQIGDDEYKTLEAAFAAATEGQTITLLTDATPALTSQRAITKAAVIDLNGTTLTLTEDDLYFGTTTFKNGTIVVDPSVKASTAVFWMFANQTLTFDAVKLVATGVTGTYLIGLDGNNSDLNLLNGSEILVANTTALDLDIICVNASTGNDILVKDSKVNVTNLDGRVFFRGNYTISGNSDIDLSGITKAGFRIEAGQTLTIADTATVDIVGEPRDGGIHLTDATATYTKADTATVNATVNAPKVAAVNGTEYSSLAAAAEAAKAGDEIVLLADATVESTLALPAGIKLTSNGHTITGSIRMLGDLELNGSLTITGGLWVGKTGETLTATLSGDKLTAGYFMFQRGSYTINADIDAVYGYLSFEATFEVNSTIHTTGANGEVLYINGNVTLNNGAVLDSDNSVFLSNENAVLTLKPGSKVDSNVSIKNSGAKLNIDATGLAAGNTANITGTVTNSVNGTIAVVGNDDLEAKIENGKIVLVKKPVAKIGEQGYETLQAAIKAAKAGQTITISAGTYAVGEFNLPAGITVVGEGEVVLEGTLKGTLENLTLKNLHIKGASAQRWAYAKGNLVFENVTFEATGVYALHFDGITAGTNLTYTNCTIIGWAAMSGSPASCVFEGCTIKDNGTYGVIRTYFPTTIKNCIFDVDGANTTDVYQDGIHAVDATITVNNCTNSNGSIEDILNISGESKIYVDDVLVLAPVVATIGDAEYFTLQNAIDAGSEIVLQADVTEEIQIADDKTIVLDLNGKTLNGCFKPFKGNLTVKNGSIVNTNASYSAIEINAGELVLTDVNVTSTRHGVRIDGAVTATINGGEYKLNATSGTRHAVNVSGAANVTIKAGTFVGPKGTTMDSGSAVNVQTGATVTIEGGNFSGGKKKTLGVGGTLTVKGGTFDQDPKAYIPGGDYVSEKQADGTYTVRELNHLVITVSPVATMSTTPITVATMDEAIAYAKANPADSVTYKITGPVELTTDSNHGILDLGNNVIIEGTTSDAKLTIVGGGVPDIKGVTFKNITIADEGTYLPTANEFMYQNFIDCSFANVTFEDGIRVSGTTTITDCTVNANTANEYAIWMDEGNFTMTNTTVTAGNDAYGLLKSDKVDTIAITGNTFKYLGTANKEALNVKGAKITASENEFIDCTKGVLPADKTNYAADGTTVITDAEIVAGNTVVNNVAKIGETKYESLAAAVAAATAGNEIILLADVTENVTLPAGVIFNGNGKSVNGITAAGEITFKGHTKATSFNVKYTNTTINIGEGACLEITGTGRIVIGHGCTFNITGTIADAKTADKTAIKPSLIIPGASFTGTNLNFNVTNAYIKFNGNSTSKNSNANGTFNFNVTNSIWEQTGVLAFYVPTQGMDPTFNFTAKDSVLTTTSHLVFSVTKGEIVFDNTNVNVGTKNQIENRSTMIIKNGSVVNGAVATSSNAINPGTVTVENATYAVTGQFSGSGEGTGTLIIKKGAKVSVGSIKDKANIVIDATGMTAEDAVDFTCNLSGFTGTLEVVNNDDLEAKIEDGKLVLVKKPVAMIGQTGYATVQEAINAAKTGETVVIMPGEYGAINISNKNITIAGTVGANGELLTTIKGGNPAITGHGFNGTIKDLKIVDAWTVMYAEPAGNVTVDNIYVTGATYGLHLVAYSQGLTWTIQNSYMDLAWANSFGVHGNGDAAIIIEGNKFESTAPYYPESGANVVNTFLPKVTVKDNIFGKNAKILIRDTITDTSDVNIATNYYADGVENAFADGSHADVEITDYYAELNADGTINKETRVELPRGNNFNGYTSTDAIWGEVWGNAKESFVIKVLDANGNVMGTSSLKNIGGIIDGDVTVSWNLKLDAASNTDEYWTMSWTTAPTIDNMPAKVELWVDGVKVGGGNVQLNGPDDLNKIVAAAANSEGKILSFHTTLTAAIEAASKARTTGNVVCVLRNVTENIAAIENVTLVTNVAGGVTVTSTYNDYVDFNNATVKSGVTLDFPLVYAENSVNTVEGTLKAGTLYNARNAKLIVQNGGKIVTTGMIVNRFHTDANAGIYVYGDNDASTVEVSCADTIGTYSGTFYTEDAVVEGNMLWIDYWKNGSGEGDSYAQSTPVFENSVVKIAKELRLYKDATLTLNNTAVTAGTVQVRENATPVVSTTDSSITAGKVENLSGCTLDAILGENGEITFQQVVAKIGNNKYYSLAEAFKAAKDGDTVKIFAGTYDYKLSITKAITVIGVGEVTLNGVPTLKGNGYTVENIDFVYNESYNNLGGSGLIKNCSFTNANGNTFRGCYATKDGAITFEGCTLTASNNGWAIHFDDAAGMDLVFIDCEIYGRVALAATLGSLTATNTEFNGGYVNVWGTEDAATFTDCGFNNVAYIFTGYDAGNTVNFNACTVNGGAFDTSIIYGGNDAAAADIYVDGTLKSGAAKIGNTYYKTLDEAFAAAQNGDEVVILKAGTYALSTSGKNITITGAVNGVEFTNIGAKNMGGANVTFNNVTFTYADNATYKGLQHSGNLVYNNCTFNGQVFLYGQSETFNKCTFNQTTNNYNVWTYGAKEVAFNECTFNSAGKSVLIYAESASLTNDVTVTNSTFNATAAVDGKAAIEMDSSMTGGITLTVTNSTATGFGKGNVSGNSLWNNKKGSNTDANNDITVVVNNETVLAPVTFVAKIGNIGYTSIAAAIKAAQAGETVTILAGDYTTDVSVNKAITVQGETDANGNNLVNITGRVSVSSGATVKNLNVHNEKTGDYDCALSVNGANIVIDGVKLTGYNGMRYCYAKGDVTIKNSTIAASYFAYHFDGSAGGKLVIDNCDITGWVSYAGTIEQVTLQNSTFDQGSYAGQRSYTKNLVIDGCTFKAGYKLDIATTGAAITVTDTTVGGESAVALFNAEDAVSSNITVDGDKITYVAKIGNTYYESLEAALADVKDYANIKLVADATLDFTARDVYGRATTEEIIIDGQGFTLTLNQTNSDWASLGVASENGKLTLKNMTIEKTGYGDTTGTWNTHAINFSSNVELNNVTVNNAIAVENGATLNNVTINEVNGYYGLWISGNGQTVTVNGGEINATNGGRGIKIADEYVDAPVSVTLNVTGTKFNTAKKAAVLVTSTAGAKITASNVDIENVAADKVNFVWVDEDRAAYNSKVTVSGCTKAQENVEIFVAQIGENYFKTLAEAIAAAQDGATITLLDNVAGSVVIEEGKNIVIDLNGMDIVGEMNAITNNGTLTINDSVGTGNVYTTDVEAQGRATIVNNGTLTINGGWFGDSNNDTTDRNAINRGNALKNYGTATINGGYFTNVSNQYISNAAYAYAINTLSGATTTINNAIVYGDINGLIYSDGKTIVNDGSFTLGRPNEENNLWYLAYGDVEIKGGTWNRAFAVPSWNTGDPTFNGDVAVSGGKFNVDVEEQFCAEGFIPTENADGTYGVKVGSYVARVNGVGYETIAAAIKAAQAGETVTILAGDYTTDISVNKAITVIGETDAEGNNLVNITGKVSVQSNATVKNLNIHNEKTGDYDCALGINGSNIVIDGVNLTGYNGLRYCYAKGDVTIKNSTINASYFAYHFDGSNGGNLLIENCEITGWVSYAGTISKVTLKDSTFNQGSYAGQRSYAKDLTIEGCTFNAGYKLDIATTGAEITVIDSQMSDGSSMASLFNSNDACGQNDITINGESLKYVAAIGTTYYATLEDALANVADWTTIKLVANATLDYNAREAYGRASTTDIIIDGQGFTLTLNQKDSDWSSIGMANADGKLTLKNMTIEKTGHGDTSGAWNTHAIIFSTPVEMNNVTVNNSIAVAADATLKNVTINEANGYYGLWIEANGQTVTVDGGSITATNGGRGIKIADQYVATPASVTLNVTGTKFSTAKKAAVLVSSTAGANITASNVDITEVEADTVNFVWVDEDWAAYNGKVVVTGCTKAQEGMEKMIAAIMADGALKGYYSSLQTAIADVKNGETIVFLTNLDEDVTINQVAGVAFTIDGKNFTYTGTMTINGTGKATNQRQALTIKNIKFVVDDFAIDAYKKNGFARNITVEGCTFTGTNGTNFDYGMRLRHVYNIVVKNTIATNLYDLVYGVGSVDGFTAENVEVINSGNGIWLSYAAGKVTFTNVTTNRIGFKNLGEKGEVTFNNCKINTIEYSEEGTKSLKMIFNDTENTLSVNEEFGHKYLTIVLNKLNTTVTAINGLKAESGVEGYRAAYVDGKYVLTKIEYVAQIGDTKFESLQAAVDAAVDGDTIVVLKSYEITCDVNPLISVAGKKVTIDLNGKTITANVSGDEAVITRIVFKTAQDAELIMTDSIGSGAVIANGDDLLHYMFRNEGKMTIKGGSYTLTAVDQGAMFFSTNSDMFVEGGNFTQTTSGWMFNTAGNGVNVITVSGGTFNRYFIGGNTVEPEENMYGEVVLAENLCLHKIGEMWTAEKTVLGEAVREEHTAATYNTPGCYDMVVYCKVCGTELSREHFEIPALNAAQIGETYYETLAEALTAAKAGETVILLVDGETENLLMVGAGVTLNLNGHTVTAGNVFSFGDIIDNDGTTDGLGGIIISNDRTKAFVQLQKGNDYLPLYDAEPGCYRFYSYSVALGKYAATSNTIKFKFNLRLSDKHAYELLADAANSGIEITARLQVTGLEQEIAYKLTNEVVKKYADAALAQIAAGKNAPSKVSTVMELNVSGLGSLASGTTITFIAEVDSETGVTYEHNVNNPERNIYTTP